VGHQYLASNMLEQFSFLETWRHARTVKSDAIDTFDRYFGHRLPIRVPPDHHGDRGSIWGIGSTRKRR
jgi:hypothetical protein